MGEAHWKPPLPPREAPHRVPLTWYMHMLGLVPLGRRAAPLGLLPVFMPSPHLPRGQPCPEPPCPCGVKPGSGGQRAPGAVPHELPALIASLAAGQGAAEGHPGGWRALTQFAPSARCRAWHRGPFIGAGAGNKSARSLNPGRAARSG